MIPRLQNLSLSLSPSMRLLTTPPVSCGASSRRPATQRTSFTMSGIPPSCSTCPFGNRWRRCASTRTRASMPASYATAPSGSKKWTSLSTVCGGFRRGTFPPLPRAANGSNTTSNTVRRRFPSGSLSISRNLQTKTSSFSSAWFHSSKSVRNKKTAGNPARQPFRNVGLLLCVSLCAHGGHGTRGHHASRGRRGLPGRASHRGHATDLHAIYHGPSRDAICHDPSLGETHARASHHDPSRAHNTRGHNNHDHRSLGCTNQDGDNTSGTRALRQ